MSTARAILPTNELRLQLTIPLIAGEENNVTALRILHAIHDKSAAIQWRAPVELSLLVMSLFASIASGSVCKSFSDNLIDGFLSGASPELQDIARWSIATPAMAAQFSFALNSTLTLSIKVNRYLLRTSNKLIKQDAKSMIIPLGIVLPTLFGGVVMSQTAFKDFPAAIAITISTLRAVAALGANMDFYLQRQKNLKGHKNIPIIRLLLETQQRLNRLAEQDSQAYLNTVSEAQLLSSFMLTNKEVSPDDLEHLIQTLSGLFRPVPFDHSAPLRQRESNTIKYLSLLLGGLTSLINWKASCNVPALFGIEIPQDFLEVFNHFRLSFLPGFLFGSIFFGIPSSYVNTAINSIACARLFTALRKVKNNISDQGLSAYLSSFNKTDIARLIAISVFSLGYGLSNGGSGYLYPFVDALRIPNGIFAAIVFTAIGFMSLDSSCNNLNNAYHRKLITDLSQAQDPQAYIASLSPDNQHKLLILVNTFLNASFDTVLDEFNTLSTAQINTLLPNALRDTLAERYGAVSAGETPCTPNVGLPSNTGIFATPPRAVPSRARLPRVISTDKLTAPSGFLAQITPSSRGTFYATSSLPTLDEERPDIQESKSMTSRSYSPAFSHNR